MEYDYSDQIAMVASLLAFGMHSINTVLAVVTLVYAVVVANNWRIYLG